MKCLQCNKNFKIINRIKSLNNKNCEIQCLNCKNTFIREDNSGRFMEAVVSGGIVFLSMYLGVPVVKKYFTNFIFGALVIGSVSAIFMLLFLVISQNWWKYKNKEI